MSLRSPLMTVLARAVEKVGRSLIRDFGEVEKLQVSKKGPGDFVSSADRRSEQRLMEELSRVRPEIGFLTEETGEHPPARRAQGSDEVQRWIIDPIDGTTNFLHGIPHWAVSVGLERRRGDGPAEYVAGVVFAPLPDEMFAAELGQGAMMNQQRLRVSGRETLADCVIGCGIPSKGRGDHPKFLAEFTKVMDSTAGIRRAGSAALDLAWVAAGRLDGYWERGLKPWDAAAGVVILREAGGYVAEIGGGPDPVFGGTIVCGNARMGRTLDLLVR